MGVLDHQHFISGNDGEAELKDHLPIRGVISKAANLFEGLVSTYLRIQRVPYSEWGDVMRSENEWHDCAFQAFFFKCWPTMNNVHSYEQIVRKMSFWINAPGKHLEYCRKVKDKFYEL